MALRVVTMGVSACGKTTVGQLLAQEFDGLFVDGDDLHPEANLSKMASGVALTDEDRRPWLQEVGRRLASASSTVVVACSALKRSYRDLIRAAAPGTAFVHLHGNRELLAGRMATRPNHFMPVSLLDSQLATLEFIGPGELGARFDIANPPAACAAAAAAWLRSVDPSPSAPTRFHRRAFDERKPRC